MLHFVTSYMKQNKSRKQTLENAQYGLEISFKAFLFFVAKCFVIYRQVFLTFLASRNLKLSFTSEIMH